MIYFFVLIGSVLIIAAFVGGRTYLQGQSEKRFVRSMRERADLAKVRGVLGSQETPIQRPTKNARSTAIGLQEIRALSLKAERALAQGDTVTAEHSYIQALTVEPTTVHVMRSLAQLYLSSDREKKAEALCKEMLLYSDDADDFALLGHTYEVLRQPDLACDAYQKALDREPNEPIRQYDLGRALSAAQNNSEAAPLLEKASARMARDVDLLHILAECYMKLGHKEHAEETYRRINKLKPYDEGVKQKLIALTNT